MGKRSTRENKNIYQISREAKELSREAASSGGSGRSGGFGGHSSFGGGGGFSGGGFGGGSR